MLLALVLVLSALVAAVKMQGDQVMFKTTTSEAEATVFEMLRNVANSAIFENTVDLQCGQALVKVNGATTTATFEGTVDNKPLIGSWSFSTP